MSIVFAPKWYQTDIPVDSVLSSGFYAKPVSTSADRYKILSPNAIQIDIGGSYYELTSQITMDLSSSDYWDTTSGVDYRIAANRAGKDFYIYAVHPLGGEVPIFKASANPTTPSGYNTTTSRKVGGFHCLCVAVGTITNHTLTGYLAGDILPNSVWDLKFRAESVNVGMVYAPGISAWVDIYLMSGTGINTTSVNGVSYTDTRTQYDFVDDVAAVNKRLLFDYEFTCIATGCNEGTNVTANLEQNTTGGHTDTSGRRMVSYIGCEDCAGVLWQWLNDSLTPYEVNNISCDWMDVTGGRGQVFSRGYTKMVAGGAWNYGVHCGSRGRSLNYTPWYSESNIGGRGLSNKRVI